MSMALYKEYCQGTTNLHIPIKRIDNSEVLIEYCENCKEEAVFKKSPAGRMDNESYKIFHQRDLLQPWHNHFTKEYDKN